MSTALTTSTRAAVPRPPRFDPRRTRDVASRLLLPSWIISLGLHVVLIIVMGQSLWRPARFGTRAPGDGTIGIIAETWNGGYPGLPGDGTGQPVGPGTGIFTGGNGQSGESPSPDEPGENAAGEPAESNSATTGSRSTTGTHAVDDGPPVELDLPQAPQLASTRIGSSRLSTGSSDARQMLKATTGSSADGQGRGAGSGSGIGDGEQGGGGKGGKNGGRGGSGVGRGKGTSFFGHEATGRRFVYVLDASGSMYDYNAIAVAKAELLASLAQLDENQQFQVIFYNERCYPMTTSGRKDELFWGTEVNRTLASQFIRNIDPDGGTRHVDALLLALSYGPDVIFFLTDAGEPVLYGADLDKIKRRNNGRSAIFTVEFGKGGNLRTDNFLKQLARDNDGSHTYRDVQQFQKH
ncbi:MAG TPA: hypothetical protein VGM05_16825 [Planctomycetaceae bacterium]